jgi:hypothetical protein
LIGQIGPREHHAELYQFLELWHTPDYHLVTESFEYRPHEKSDRWKISLMSREYIGVMKLFAQERKVTLHQQTAAVGKGFVSDDKLRIMGLWVPGKQHARDAYRHLITYMVKNLGRKDLIASWKNL